jgi:copper chaperone NosL
MGMKRVIASGLVAVTTGLLLASCQRGEAGPVAIVPEDMCAYCRMAISEKRFAAQFIDIDGQPFKFDDIGCMIKVAGGKRDKGEIAAYFVMDFDERQWVKADDAYYVSSPELKTPMEGHAAAFKDEAKAREAAARFHGRLLGFADLFRHQ